MLFIIIIRFIIYSNATRSQLNATVDKKVKSCESKNVIIFSPSKKNQYTNSEQTVKEMYFSKLKKRKVCESKQLEQTF